MMFLQITSYSRSKHMPIQRETREMWARLPEQVRQNVNDVEAQVMSTPMPIIIFFTFSVDVKILKIESWRGIVFKQSIWLPK